MSQTYEIGIIGLGTTGRNLVLNFAGQGYSVACYDKDAIKVQSLKHKTVELQTFCTESIEDFLTSLTVPRTIMMFAAAGPATDASLAEIQQKLNRGDLIIDGSNSYYKDTNRRTAALAEKGISFLGMGVSGGEQGARYGPSITVGGEPADYERVAPLLEAAAARVDGKPCVSLVGTGSAGHYAKMVYNGIEIALMQLIAESYSLLKKGLGLGADKLQAVYEQWNREELQSYLIEITAQVFRQVDEKSGSPLIDVILDQTTQKGPGKWSTQAAIDLDVPVPVIEMAISMRSVSRLKAERETASAILAGPKHIFQGERKVFIEQLKNALYAGMIVTFAQGMAQIRKASHLFNYGMDLSEVSRVWRGGSIIRTPLLKEISISFKERPDLANLLLDPYLGQEVMARQADLRTVVRTAADLGIPAAALMASLVYYDSYRSEWLPANLVQAQRDIFGAHTYERIDAKGFFHTRWHQE